MNTFTVLCVDDDVNLREWIQATLRPKGYRVLLAQGGGEALTLAAEQRPDLILLDVTMPDMDGYEVCTRLQGRPETACIPVIFVTVHGDLCDKLRAFRAGAADYLVKPVESRDLLEKVKAHLETKGRWAELQKAKDAPGWTQAMPPLDSRWDGKLRPSDFSRFKDALAVKMKLPPESRAALARIGPAELYSHSAVLGIPAAQVARATAEFLSLKYSPALDGVEVKLGIFPRAFCTANLVVPLVNPSETTVFALSNPFLWEVQEAIKRSVQRDNAPILIVTEPANLESLLKPRTSVPQKKKVELSELQARLAQEYSPEPVVADLTDAGNEQSAPIIQLVNTLIDTAFLRGASDIHLEPAEDEVVVRYRIDGDLSVANRLRPGRLIQPLVARIKIMAGLDIAERRLPQDGRIKFKGYTSTGKDFDLRVAVAPVNFGEKIVMRVIDKQKSVLPLSELGFSGRNLDLYRERIRAPYGMILHVGPTGSGKSMTLYAALNEVKNPTLNIQTAEDPIEYTLPGINQTQVHREIGLTFQRALRSFLRLDPDVILVGEIRDRETAETAIEASMTGHLLLSTLHTNDAATTVTRFIEMGIEPYLIGSSLLAVCAQRLLRRLCKECKEAYTPDAAARLRTGAPERGPVTLYRGRGCGKCAGTGYRGRIGIHEVLSPDEAFRMDINRIGVSAEQLKKAAVERLGMTTLYWDAMEKVRGGIASLEDALANVKADEFESRPAWMRRNDPSALVATSR
jgi:type IV pilus assembly protein PilB